MENNTVTIDLDLYNDLRDFKRNMEDELTYVAGESSYGYVYRKYVTHSEAFKMLEADYKHKFKELKRSNEVFNDMWNKRTSELKMLRELPNIDTLNIFQIIWYKLTK